MITVYIGDITPYLADLAKAADSAAKIITHTDFENLTPGTYYTSLGDLQNVNNLGRVFQQANKIVYCPPDRWSDQKGSHSALRQWTEDYVRIYSFVCQIENYMAPVKFDKDKLLALADHRKTDQKQLWIAGCSLSHGIGVSESTRYGQLLADKTGMPASFLTYPGSNISWAADQIL